MATALTDDRVESASETEWTSTEWTPFQRVAYRFLSVYLVLYLVNAVLVQELPLPPKLLSGLQGFLDGTLWGPAVRSLARLVHLRPAGAYGNSIGWDVMNVLGLALVAAIATAVWSAVDRRRRDYRTLDLWFRTFLRFSVAAMLINFGVDKLLLYQMGTRPVAGVLLEHVGYLIPQQVLWASMGASSLYQFFAGAVEATAGLLLCFRTTATLGALLALGAMTNVAMLDWGYLPGLALMSTHGVLACVVLLAGDARRLTAAILSDAPVPPRPRRTLLRRPEADRAVRGLGVAFAVWMVAGCFYFYTTGYPIADVPWAVKWPPFEGAYDVEAFVANGDTLPPLMTDATRWRSFFIDMRDFAPFQAVGEIQFMPDAARRRTFHMRVNEAKGTMTFALFRNPADTITWTYSQPDSQHLLLKGMDFSRPGAGAATNMPARSLSVLLRRVDLSKLPLLQRRPWFVQR